MTDKEKIRAEIERQINCFRTEKDKEGASQIDKLSLGGRVAVLEELLSFINSLPDEPVSEGLEKEIKKYISDNFFGSETTGFFAVRTKEEPNDIDMALCAKYFFKLGLNANNPLTWNDMLLIHKCIKDTMYFKIYKMMEGIEGQKEVYEEALKRFKAQKEEKSIKI